MMLGVASSDPSLAADVSTLSPADAAAMVAAAAAALRGQKDLQWMLPLLSGGGASNNRSDQQAGSSSSDRSNAQAQQQQHRKRQLSEAGDSTAVPHDPAAQRHLQKQSLAALSPAALLAAAGAVCGQGSNKKPRHQAPLGNGGPPAAKTRFTWAPELHAAFISAVEQLGGAEAAKPADILSLMPPVPGLSSLTIKSHLQKYRQATREQRLLLLAAQQQQQQPDAVAAAQAGVMKLLAAQAAAAADAAATTAAAAAAQQQPWLPQQPDAVAHHSSCQAPAAADLSSLQLLCDMAVLEAGLEHQEHQEQEPATSAAFTQQQQQQQQQQHVLPADEPAVGFPAGGFGAVLPAMLAAAHRRRSSSSSDAVDGSWAPPPAAPAAPAAGPATTGGAAAVPARGLPVSFQMAPGLPAAADGTAAAAAGPPSPPGVPHMAMGAAALGQPAAAVGAEAAGGPSPPAAPDTPAGGDGLGAPDASLLSSNTAAFLHAIMQPLDPGNRACLAAVLQLATLQGVITWHEPQQARPCGPPPGLTALLQCYMAEAAAAAAAGGAPQQQQQPHRQ